MKQLTSMNSEIKVKFGSSLMLPSQAHSYGVQMNSVHRGDEILTDQHCVTAGAMSRCHNSCDWRKLQTSHWRNCAPASAFDTITECQLNVLL